MDKHIILKIFQALLLGFFIYELYLFISKFKKYWKFNVSIWKEFQWPVILRNLLLLIPFFILIYLFRNIPFLKISWLSLIYNKRGSLIFSEDAVSLLNSIPTILILIFLVLFLILLIPQLVQVEEQIFRFKRVSRKSRIISSIVFGLVHGFVGVNLMGMILIMFFGYYLSKIYLVTYHKFILNCTANDSPIDTDKAHRAALFTSTIYHACWNTMILTLLLAGLLYALGVHLYFQ